MSYTSSHYDDSADNLIMKNLERSILFSIDIMYASIVLLRQNTSNNLQEWRVKKYTGRI